MSKLPSTQLARVGVVGSTAMKIGVGKIKSKAKRPFLSAQARDVETDKQEVEEAEILFKAVTQLRGTAVKLAQMLGMETELLPPRVRQELTKSYHQIPPLNRVLVQKAVFKEFGEYPDQVFMDFDGDAIAAASLGQVHRAVIEGGQEVAVKVQYPGIHVSIETDLKLLKKLVSSGINLLPRHRKPNSEIVDASIDEIGFRLKEETDYYLEAKTTKWFGQHLLLDGVEIPQVYDKYCTERIITTQMMEGKHLDEWLAENPSQELRNRAGQLIYDLFFFSTMQLRCVHADPNPGNYLFKENGELSLIDFGCVKKLGDQFADNLPQLLHAYYLDDFEKIVQAYENIGMTITRDGLGDAENVLRSFGEWLSAPFKESSFDFKENNDHTKSGLDLIRGMAENACMETVEEDFIFFDRTIYGLFKIFERLEAKINLRGHWESYWSDYENVQVWNP